MFGTFIINVDSSTNRFTSNAQKIGTQPLITAVDQALHLPRQPHAYRGFLLRNHLHEVFLFDDGHLTSSSKWHRDRGCVTPLVLSEEPAPSAMLCSKHGPHVVGFVMNAAHLGPT
jgi:hypothetical protein